MQQTIRKLKRKWKKSFRNIMNQMTFIFKLALSLIVFFFLILFFIVEPLDDLKLGAASQLDRFTQNQKMTENEFIQEILPHAKKVQATHGTHPSVLIAQAALESDWGNSMLSRESNNYFGIKGANSGKEYVTKEFDSNEWTEISASFKQYSSMAESVEDYANLLLHGTSWDSNYYSSVLESSNYQEAAYSLQEAGYATDPGYAHKLIQIIEQYQLYEFDE